MLNGRNSLKRKFNGLSNSPFHFSNASSRPAEFVTKLMSKDTYPMDSPTSVSQSLLGTMYPIDRSFQAMVISVSTEVETTHHEDV